MKQTFNEFYQEFASDYRFGEPSSVQEVDEFEQKYDVKFPDELRAFYQQFGSFKNSCDRYIYDRLGDLWGYNHDYHLAGASNGYNVNRHKIINDNYIAVATVGVDDNSNMVVYFEKDKPNAGFGLVYDNQDSGVVFEDYLDVMLVNRGDDLNGVSKVTKPLAKYTLAQILGALVMFMDTPEFYEDDLLKNFKGEIKWVEKK